MVNASYSFNVHGIIYISEDGESVLGPTTLAKCSHW